jgi:drug/metabolite transporter (DMT)-like permease
MGNDRLTISQIVLLTAYAAGMAGGQILFKMAALRYAAADGTLYDRLLGLVQNVHFLLALLLYAALAVLWVWVLSFTPLSRAYPFVALAFVLTPLLGGWLFGETISWNLLAGLVIILCGLVLVMS